MRLRFLAPSEMNQHKREIVLSGTVVGRSFDRRQIEGCCLRVGGAVLLDIIAMVEEVSALPVVTR